MAGNRKKIIKLQLPQAGSTVLSIMGLNCASTTNKTTSKSLFLYLVLSINLPDLSKNHRCNELKCTLLSLCNFVPTARKCEFLIFCEYSADLLYSFHYQFGLMPVFISSFGSICFYKFLSFLFFTLLLFVFF